MSATVVGPAKGVSTRAVLAVLAAVCCGVGAAVSGVGAAGDTKLAVLLPVVICAGVIVAVIAMTRFAAYVFLMLLIRASIDATKLTADGTVARLLTPSTLVAVLFIIAASLWLVARYQAHGRLPGSGLRRALIFFVCTAALSMVGAAQLVPSVADVLRLLAIVLMFAVLEQLMADRQTMMHCLLAVFLSAVFPLLYTAIGFAIGSPAVEVKGGITRVIGTFVQSNTFGDYLMLLVVVGVAIYPHVRGPLRIGLAGLLGACAVCLVLTYTLTALAAAFIGLAVVGLRQSKRLLLVLVVAAAVALVAAPSLSARFAAVTNQTTYATPATVNGNRGNSLAWRLDYWAEIAPLANQNPLTGIGFGMTSYETAQGKQPHNDYLRAYVETGALGLLAYLILVMMLLRTGWRAAKAAPSGTLERGVAVGYLGCAVAMAVASVVSNEISGVVELWYLVAFAAAASCIVRRESVAGPRSTRRDATSASSRQETDCP